MREKTSNKSIGLRIKELRERNNETQKKLADLLDTTQNSISKMERGVSGLSINNLVTIAEHYKVSLDYLCKGEGGSNVLDTLLKYVKFEYSTIKEIAGDHNRHFIPMFSINKYLYDYLEQTAQANSSHKIPDNIKNLWLKQAEENFNRTIIEDSYSDYHTFIPLDQTVLAEQRSIINEIEKYIDR